MAGPARTVWRPSQDSYAVFALAKSRVWKKMFEVLAADVDNEFTMIDSTIVRAHQHNAGAKKAAGNLAIGRGKGGLSTKIRNLADALGNPLAFFLAPGQSHDLNAADMLLPQMEAGTLLGGKAYDADQRVFEPLQKAGKLL